MKYFNELQKAMSLLAENPKTLFKISKNQIFFEDIFFYNYGLFSYS
jgi:hypothetical protein